MDIVEPPRFALGDEVRVIGHPSVRGVVVGLYGPIGPKSERAYRLRVRGRPDPAYTIALDEQLEPAVSRTSLAPPPAPQIDCETESQ